MRIQPILYRLALLMKQHDVLLFRLAIFVALPLLLAGIVVARTELSFLQALLVAALMSGGALAVFRYSKWRKIPRSESKTTQRPSSPQPTEQPADSRGSKRRLLRRRKKELPRPEDLQPIPRAELSSITIKYSGLTDEELDGVYYDDAPHWTVVLRMIFNPYWYVDNDLHPVLSQDELDAGQQAGDNQPDWVMKLFRVVVRIAQVAYTAFALLVVVWSVFRLWELLPAVPSPSDLLLILAVVTFLACTTIWTRYIIRLNQRIRLVGTDYTIRKVIDQLPWRPQDRPSLTYEYYSTAKLVTTQLGEWLGYKNARFSTIDPGEPLPGWNRARNPDRLQLLINRWDARKRREARMVAEVRVLELQDRQASAALRAEGSSHRSTDETQPIPVWPTT